MSKSNRLSRYLGLSDVHQGQVHIDLLKVPDDYPQELLYVSPTLIREDLEKYQTNLIPLIIRSVTTPARDVEYEVVFGKEVVDFARELGIKQLWATRVELADDQEVSDFQERIKRLMQIHAQGHPSQQEGSYLQSPLSVSGFTNILDRHLQPLKKQIESIHQEMAKQSQQVMHLSAQVKTLSNILGSSPTGSQNRRTIRINSYRDAESLKKRVPGLTIDEAQVVIGRLERYRKHQGGRKFCSVDELKEIAPSGHWDSLSICFN
ncbi:tll1394 [Thermosynechococcus vestitus BP-1]|uniref:Tll1394 protein n=1 Tax=Thermosynechococcus vestitus (strain NIES-2133 / IAM M-273 / BP-1) TaxID=197221 RepID=Q8DJ35_THEVB|nr:tll1394 [Thermosynechococcus vestitus BP-1]